MATLSLDNAFASYDLAPAEERAGKVLSSAQVYVIQNKLSQVAHQRLNVVFDTVDPHGQLKDTAWLDGQIMAYRGMLQDHEMAIKEALALPTPKAV